MSEEPRPYEGQVQLQIIDGGVRVLIWNDMLDAKNDFREGSLKPDHLRMFATISGALAFVEKHAVDPVDPSAEREE